MPCKMFSSQKSQKNQRKYIEFVSELMLSYHGRPCRELSNVEMYISGLFRQVVLFFIEGGWANRASTKVRPICTGYITFSEFFEDCSKSDPQIWSVHHKSIIPDQCASPGTFVVSRKNRFGVQFWLQSFFPWHAKWQVRRKVRKIVDNTSNSYQKSCFRIMGVPAGSLVM